MLSSGLAIVFLISIVTSADARYAINGMTSSGGIATLTWSEYGPGKVGNVLREFFENPKWTSYKVGGQKYVDFTGDCQYMGSDAQARLIFGIYNDSF